MITDETRKYREEVIRKRSANSTPAPKAPAGGGTRNARFAPLNAARDGGWVAKMSGNEFKVLGMIWSLGAGSNQARISHGALARMCGMQRNHVATATAKLERWGLLRVVERGRTMGKRGKRTANVYEVLVPEPVPGVSGEGSEEDD